MNQITEKIVNCSTCFKSVPITIDKTGVLQREDHKQIYTAYHRCVNGQFTATNLYFGESHKLQSVQNVNLPKPIIDLNADEYREVTISRLPITHEFGFSILFHSLGYVINISNTSLEPAETFQSPNDKIEMHVHTDDELGGELRNWFTTILNNLEKAEKIHIGMIVEVLTYAMENRHGYPGQIDTKIIEKIINSRIITYDLLKQPGGEVSTYLKNTYDEEEVDYMLKILNYLKSHPGSPAISLAQFKPKDFPTILKLVLKLEKEEIIEQHKKSIPTSVS